MLRGDIAKDDSGAYAVFIEQGSSASQMTAAKVIDIISRLPGCSGQAADAMSAYTQVKMEDVPTSLKFPKSECPDIWIRLPKHKWPKSCPVWKIQSFLSNEICTVTFWQDCYGKGILRKFCWNIVGRRFPNGNVLFVNRAKRTILVFVCGRYNPAGKTENTEPTWKILMKDVDLEEATSFSDHENLVCTQRECTISNCDKI